MARQRIQALSNRLSLRADLAIQAQARESGDAALLETAESLSTPPAWLAPAAWGMRVLSVVIIVALAMKAGPSGLWLGCLVAGVVGFPLDAWVANRFAQAGDPSKLARAAAAWRSAMVALRQKSVDDPALADWREQADATIDGCAQLAGWAESRVRRGNPLWQGISAIIQAQAWAWRGPLPTSDMRQWVEFLAEVEAVSCLATWSAERGGVLPEVATGDVIIEAKDLRIHSCQLRCGSAMIFICRPTKSFW